MGNPTCFIEYNFASQHDKSKTDSPFQKYFFEYEILIYDFISRKMDLPGIEPGSHPCKGRIITIRLQALKYLAVVGF